MDYSCGSLALSGIRHYLFCKRSWALVHIEQQWVENYFTADGRVMHERAHDETCRELRGNILAVRGLRVCSGQLGIHGECDVVEYHRDSQGVTLSCTDGLWIPYPVEYKRGQRKISDCDRAQLCAQAMCLEEMHGCIISEGALYYGLEAHREIVTFGRELRDLVEATCESMHSLFTQGITPAAEYSKSCENCSLSELCIPRSTRPSVKQYLQNDLDDN